LLANVSQKLLLHFTCQLDVEHKSVKFQNKISNGCWENSEKLGAVVWGLLYFAAPCITANKWVLRRLLNTISVSDVSTCAEWFCIPGMIQRKYTHTSWCRWSRRRRMILSILLICKQQQVNTVGHFSFR